MKIVIISDTHNQHEKLTIPKGDMIIHCGDVSGRGWYEEVRQFCNWFGELDFKYKIMIAGNHDFFFEGNLSTVKGTRSYYSQAEEKNEFEKKKALLFQSDIIYLENSGIEIEGIKIWGSPYTPRFFNWAFLKDRGGDIANVWKLIPNNLDILITHGPPVDILDLCQNGHVGCCDLKETIINTKPKYHIFGHIHEGYGIHKTKNTTYINASVLDGYYNCVNEPIVIEINSKL